MDRVPRPDRGPEPGDGARPGRLGRLGRLGRILAGSALVLAGLVMWVLPGPGLVTIAAGLAVLGRDVPVAARLLERLRRRLPHDADGRTRRGVVVASVGLGAVSVGGSVVALLA